MAVNERQQFRLLHRDFLARIVDLEILSAGGEIQKLLIQFAAMLAAFSFVVTVWIGPNMGRANMSREKLLVSAWSVEEFFIASTMAIAGLLAVLAWNSVLPGRRDCLILGLLPVRTRTVFLAKAAAIGTALAITIGASNSFIGLVFPPMLGGLRGLVAYWLTVAAAGAFVCCAFLAIQGVLAQLLPYRLFLRVSSWVQLASFFFILGIYFLKPPFRPDGPISQLLPSTWFFGLFQILIGGSHPTFPALAIRALWSLAVALALATATFSLAYARNLRRIVEQPDIAPSDRGRPATRIGSALAARLLPKSIERAVILFTARTIARSRQHRLLLAAYMGIGLAVGLAYARELIYGSSDFDPTYYGLKWYQLNGSLIAASVVFLVFAIIGTRAVFAMPIALPANWIFRITAVHSPAAYFAAIRKSLFALAAGPVWIAAALIFPAIWPTFYGVAHVILLGAMGMILIEFALYRFRKMPFACSYLPGKANIHVRLGAGGIAFLGASSIVTHIEFAVIPHIASFTTFLAILAAIAFWAHRRTAEFAALPGAQLQFEDLPRGELTGLSLVHESPAHEVYIDDGREPAPPFRFDTLIGDLRYGARILRNAPAFSVAAIALIALGIGGNTAIYSMIHGVLTKPAPGVTATDLVMLGIMKDGEIQYGDPSDSYLNYLEYASQTRSLRSLAALRAAGPRMTMELPNGTYEVRGQLVSANVYDTLGVPIVRGRTFTEEEERGIGPTPAIIAYHIWQNFFAGTEDIIGRRLILNGQPATIVGVSGPRFAGPQFAPNLEVAVPLTIRSPLARRGLALADRASHGVEMIGRLKPRRSLSEAQAEFDTISRRLQFEFPEANKGRSIILAPYSASAFGPIQAGQLRVFMAILLAVALLTLVIVCANVANLMLGRAAVRQREMAVRQSLGASRFRILTILLDEGLTLSAAGALAAWLFALWACSAIVKFVPPLESGARLDPNVSPDWRVAGYARVLAAFAALAFTLVPAVRTWRQDLLPWLKAGEQGVIQGRSRLANALVVAQLALCCLLLTAAGLASRSITLMDTTDLYFNKDHLLLAGINTAGAAASGEQNLAVLEQIRKRIAALPGVVTVSYSPNTPPRAWTGMLLKSPAAATPITTDGSPVGPNYLEALGIPVLIGRGLTENDTSGVTVINQKLAATLWPGQSPIGRTLALDDPAQPMVVVGVVPDGAFSGIGRSGSMTGVSKEQRGNFVFFPERLTQASPGEITFHVRYAGSMNAVAPAIRAAIHDVDARVPVFSLQSMEAAWGVFTSPVHLMASLLEIFGVGSLVLASLGLYAVAAFYTARRTREFGIRMALGASPAQTIARVLREGFVLTAIGGVLGIALSIAVGRVLGKLLFGVTATDPVTFAGVILLLAVVSTIACYLPARRAARVDPTQALRQE